MVDDADNSHSDTSSGTEFVRSSYSTAEDLADDLALSRGGRWAVVEDFQARQLVVFGAAGASDLIDERDAERSYTAGPVGGDLLDAAHPNPGRAA